MIRIFFLSLFFLFGSFNYGFCQKDSKEKNIVLSTQVSSFDKSLKKDWNEIQEILKKYSGECIGVNNKVATSGMPDGPLLGNGNTGWG